MNFFNNFFNNLFQKRWLITLIGVLALSVIIWFAGPLIAIADKVILQSQVSRLIVIMVLILIWGLNNLRSQAKARKQEQQLIDGIKEDNQLASKEVSDEEVKLLDERFNDALQVLKHSSNKRQGKQYLYELPWYVIIGPPGSGKTTALVNSGLKFPLSEKYGYEAIKGVGGTRNCDWWFTDEAVLIDTAGRYTTQDSHAQQDSLAWHGFLKLLKKHRKRRPINGVMVAISLADIMTQTEQEKAAHSHAIRSRLLELQNQLNIRFPVYLLITKSDLISGFSEFFDDLGRDEREQVWGMTFADSQNLSQNLNQKQKQGSNNSNKSTGENFSEQFGLLLDNLNDRLLWRLNYERDPLRRGKIVEFPSQLQAVQTQLEAFVEQTFSTSRFHERPDLRGVYFTSGTQEGTPIDRIMGKMMANYDLDPQVLPARHSQGKSFFIKNLLQKVIFTEAELVGVNRRFENRILWLQRISYAAAISTATASALAWSTSFTLNDRSIKKVEQHINAYKQSLAKIDHINFYDINQQLLQLQQANAIFPAPDNIPLSMQLGLYQGFDFHQNLARAYTEQNQQLFLPALQARIEEQIRLGMSQPDYLFEALKAYLMLSQPEHFEAAFVQQWMKLDWSTHLSGEAELQQQYTKHLKHLLASDFQAIKVNQSLVDQARAVLKKVPLPIQIYNRIKSEANNTNDEAFTFASIVGPEMNTVFSGTTRDIPYLYTYDGYKNIFVKDSFEYVRKIAQENWVLGTKKGDFSTADIELFNDKVKALYLEDYARYWKDALDSLQVNNFNSASQAINVLTQITGPYSPFRGVIEQVAENTRLSQLPVDAAILENNKALTSEISSKITGRTGTMVRMVKRVSDRKLINLPDRPTDIVEKQFFDLNRSIKQENKRSSHLDKVMTALAQLQGYLNTVSSTMDNGETAYRLARKRLSSGSDDALGRLKLLASRSPEPLKTWLKDISRYSWDLVLNEANHYLNSVYETNVLAFYQQSIKKRYPIYSRASNEVSLADFTEYFKPGGIEQNFFNQYLKDFVNTRSRPWSLKHFEGSSLKISHQALRQFERAENIRRVFFKKNKDYPKIKYALKPLYLDSNIARFELKQGQQRVVYRHGPLIPIKMHWPDGSDVHEAKIMFEDLNGDRVAYKEDGPWAFFRIMDNYELKKTKSNNHFVVDYVLEGKKAKFELIANSSTNPFGHNLLQRYRAPQKLN